MSSHLRKPTRNEKLDRKFTDEGDFPHPRPSSQQYGEGKTERVDQRGAQSPQPSIPTSSNMRLSSTNQSSSRAIDEKLTERIRVTTTEILTSKTRSPERKSSLMAQTERPKPAEDSRSRESRSEAPSMISWEPEAWRQL